MPKINDTSAYPSVTPTGDDYVIGSDGAGLLPTKTFLFSAIATFINAQAPVPTLQSVVDSGATSTTSIQLTGSASLSVAGPITSNGALFVIGNSTYTGAIDANSTADIADTLTLSKASGTGLSVTADATIGGIATITGAIDANSTADIADTLTLSKATGTGLQVNSDVNIDGDLFVGSIESATGNLIINDSGSTERIRLSAAGALTFQGDATFTEKFILSAGAPATASSTGTKDEVAIDANYIYICTATNTWKRVAIATW